VENGQEYFSLYNLESKKAQWVSRADGGDLRVQGYDPVAGLELADQTGRTIRLALKAGNSTGGGIRLRPGTALAATPAGPMPVAVPASASESQRLEQVAEQIRARRTQRQQQTGRI